MKVRKAIKKIAALGAGITMVGATILGAMAADLSAYPAPFVQNGQFNALIIVGDQAAAQDVVGAVDVGANLQFAMRQEVAVSGGGMPVVTISEGKKIDKTGDHLNYGDEIQDVLGAPLDNADLPVLLADNTYNDNEGQTDNKEDYEQRLYFYDTLGVNNGTVNKGTGLLTFAADSNGDKVAADYLMFDDDSGDYMYRYKLLFDTSVDYTNTSTDTPAADLENTVVKIQGDDYTVIDVQYTTTDYRANKFTLLSGETIIWLQQGKTIKRTVSGVEHEVEVTDVNDAENMCGVSVDGDVVWIDKGNTQTVNGVTIGVTDAVAVHAQLQDVDICKLNVGAREIIIENGKEIKVDGVKVSGSDGDIIAGDVPSQKWDGFNVTFTPQDATYVPKGGSIVDPIFGKFEARFEGVSKTTEEMTLSTTSDGAEFTFYNNNGDLVTIPLYMNFTESGSGSVLNLGDDFSGSNCDGRLLLEGDNCDVEGAASFNAVEGVMFLLVTSGKEAHVMEIADISSNTEANTTDIKDLTTGKVYEDKKFTVEADSLIELGSLGTVTLNIGYDADPIFTATNTMLGTTSEQQIIETKYGANLSIVPRWGSSTTSNGRDTVNHTTFVIVEEENQETNNLQWNLSVFWYTTDEELRINAPTLQPLGATTPASQWNNSNVRASKSDKYTKYYADEWGTLVTYDSYNKNDLTLAYPDEQVIGNVFIAPIGATVTGAGGGELTTVTLNPINVASKLASEIEGQEKTQNLIVVGGPCANNAAKVIMGASEDCTAGFEAGKAMIKLYENGNNVAMLVAGYGAADTRRATTVVANYKDYALSGKEVVVTGTSLSDIKVEAPQ
ncbi:hypothetical protein COV19_06165 [Candidatus Woesearchaeota archaeon CG10_big_fil_rev_8_21_14_0_10_44_13]|nr:MAG: hypothetical protein COV19_06165 [Candidatus Woesearchaeota archaeon CG10_big_fil_rev_8_21_14_0_10_44_13]